MDSGGGAHGETAILCCQGNPTASESQGDLSGAEETHTSRGGVVVTLSIIENTYAQTKTAVFCHFVFFCPADAVSV